MRSLGMFLIFLLLSSPLLAETKPLTILSHDRPPFHYESSDGEVVGICVDIVDTIFREMDIEYEIISSSWARVYYRIQSGFGEAAFSASRKKPREPFLYYPQTDMWRSEFVFFVRAENKEVAPNGDIEDIVKSGKMVGIWRGASYHSKLWKHFPYKDGTTEFDPKKITMDIYNDQLYPATAPVGVLKMVGANRVTFGLEDRIVGLYLLKKNKIAGNVIPYENSFFSKGYPMPFIKKSNYPNLKKISEEFEKLLIAMKKDGRYKAIVDRWIY